MGVQIARCRGATDNCVMRLLVTLALLVVGCGDDGQIPMTDAPMPLFVGGAPYGGPVVEIVWADLPHRLRGPSGDYRPGTFIDVLNASQHVYSVQLSCDLSGSVSYLIAPRNYDTFRILDSDRCSLAVGRYLE